MILWNIEALKQAIRNNQLTATDRMLHLLLFSLQILGLYEAADYITSYGKGFWNYVHTTANVVIVLVGTLLAFRLGGGKKHEDFISRFVSVSFVTALRVLLAFGVLFMFFAGFYFNCMSDQFEDYETHLSEVLPFMLMFALYYWRVIHHLRDLDQAASEESE